MSRPTCRVLSAGHAAGLLFWAAIVMACLEGPAAWAAIPSDELLQKLQSQGAISDFAGLLTPAERAAIENRLGQLRQKTGSQFALVTLPSLEGGQIDDFANKLFAKWGVGQKGKNNGVMLLVAEQYPDLKANANFRDLQYELSGTENRISVERQRYNDVARAYNTAVRQFPGSLVAGMRGFAPNAAYFEAASAAKEAPKVDFGTEK
jgi:hypothetical protein